MGVLIALDTENAQLYLGAIAPLAVLGTVLTFGALLHVTTPGDGDRDRRGTYARVMIALVSATAGTVGGVGGVGGGAAVSSSQNDDVKKEAAAAKTDAGLANKKAAQAQEKIDQVERAQPKTEQPQP